jgi:hypothetical protein
MNYKKRFLITGRIVIGRFGYQRERTAAIDAADSGSAGHLRTRRTPVMAYQFIRENGNRYPIREMVGLLRVNTSAYYQ